MLRSGQLADQAILLGYVSHAPGPADLTGARPDSAGTDLKERRLARAVGAHDRHDLPRSRSEGHSVEHAPTSVRLRNVAYFEEDDPAPVAVQGGKADVQRSHELSRVEVCGPEQIASRGISTGCFHLTVVGQPPSLRRLHAESDQGVAKVVGPGGGCAHRRRPLAASVSAVTLELNATHCSASRASDSRPAGVSSKYFRRGPVADDSQAAEANPCRSSRSRAG